MPELSFHIHSADLDQVAPESTRLILQAGETHLVVLLTEDASGKIIALHYYRFPAGEIDEAYRSILESDSLLKRDTSHRVVVSHYREHVLVPSILYAGDGAERILAMIHGDLRRGTPMQDSLETLGIQNLHRMPEDLEASLKQALPGTSILHESTLVLRWLSDHREMLPAVYVYLQVYPSQVTVTVMRDGICQLVQTYPYDIPEDLSYHLLNTCEQLGLDPEQVPLIVSGLIDPESPLFLELLKYFRHLETQSASACGPQDPALGEVPPHYFTPQNILAVCV